MPSLFEPLSLDPRIALIGPKGGGKTMYRNYLAHFQRGFKPYLQATLGVKALGFENPAYRISHEGGRWQKAPETLEGYTFHRDHRYLPKVGSTSQLTMHELPLPTFDRSLTQMLDFPGEFWTKGHDRSVADDVEAALDNCRMVILILPYWLLIPRRLRSFPPPFLESIAELAGVDEISNEDARHEREDDMLESLSGWLGHIQGLVEGASNRRPMLLVAFSMLSRSWEHEISRDACGDVLCDHLASMRTLARQSDMVQTSNTGSWWSELTQRISQVGAAGRLRRIVRQLDASCRLYVRETQNLWQTHDNGYEQAEGVWNLLDRPATHIRLLAMNIVTERFWLVPRTDRQQFGPAYQYLRVDTAGASLPMVYLAANLDRLR